MKEKEKDRERERDEEKVINFVSSPPKPQCIFLKNETKLKIISETDIKSQIEIEIEIFQIW